MVWSNKYNPFDSIVVASKGVGEWVANPNAEERISWKIDSENQHLIPNSFYF